MEMIWESFFDDAHGSQWVPCKRRQWFLQEVHNQGRSGIPIKKTLRGFEKQRSTDTHSGRITCASTADEKWFHLVMCSLSVVNDLVIHNLAVYSEDMFLMFLAATQYISTWNLTKFSKYMAYSKEY